MYICNANNKNIKIMETQTTSLPQFLREHLIKGYNTLGSTDPIWDGLIIDPKEMISKTLACRVVYYNVYFHNIQKLWIPGILETLNNILEENSSTTKYWDIKEIHFTELKYNSPSLLTHIILDFYLFPEEPQPLSTEEEYFYHKSNDGFYHFFLISRY